MRFSQLFFSRGHRSTLTGVAWNKRMFMSTLSSEGVALDFFNAPELHQLARLIEFWLIDARNLLDLKDQLPELTVNEEAVEAGPEYWVSARWNELLSRAMASTGVHSSGVRSGHPATAAAAYAGGSIGRYLSFSRTIGYPFLKAGGCAAWFGNDYYRALGPDGRILSEGMLEDVLDTIEQTVHDAGPVLFGTADDPIVD